MLYTLLSQWKFIPWEIRVVFQQSQQREHFRGFVFVSGVCWMRGENPNHHRSRNPCLAYRESVMHFRALNKYSVSDVDTTVGGDSQWSVAGLILLRTPAVSKKAKPTCAHLRSEQDARQVWPGNG